MSQAKQHRQMPAVRATVVIALAAVVACPLSANGGSSKDPARGVAQRSSPRTAWPEGHLYVLDAGGLAVDRFPLASDGLPAKQPDSVLNLEGVLEPQGLAVDRRGNVFVADQGANENTGGVYEYAAGATGRQKSIASLSLPNDAPDFLEMDSRERLYVHYGGG